MDGGTSLHQAARQGHLEVLYLLLKHRSDPAQPARNGAIPLHWAAMAGQKDCCKVLVKRGGLSVEQLDDLNALVPPAIQEELKKGQCSGCGRARALQEKFRACSRCEKTRYCSKECQKKHWKGQHKKECKTPEEQKQKEEQKQE